MLEVFPLISMPRQSLHQNVTLAGLMIYIPSDLQGEATTSKSLYTPTMYDGRCVCLCCVCVC